jgi:hypothetical protein
MILIFVLLVGLFDKNLFLCTIDFPVILDGQCAN